MPHSRESFSGTNGIRNRSMCGLRVSGHCSFISRKKICWDIFLVLQVFYSKVIQIILEIVKAGKLKLIYAKYDKSRIEILSSAVFYLPRDMPVEDFYRPGTQEKKLSH